jgi:hypothetical protein
MALSITGGSGDITSQANTQSPQTSAGSGSAPTAAAKNVQPGTATSLLSGPGGGSVGIPLNSTVLPVANLGATTQTATAQPQQAVAQPKHHPNAVLLGVVAILVVLAVLAFWLTGKSAKNTTHY